MPLTTNIVPNSRLTVLDRYRLKGRRFAKCRCACGGYIDVEEHHLANGHTASCGCLHKEHVARMQQARRLPQGRAARNALYGNYRRTAKHRNVEFSLTFEDFDVITTNNCYYCGQPPSQTFWSNSGRTSECIYNGIDRLDNSAGYMLANSVPCCGICNNAKRTLTVEQFDAWIKRLAKHRFGAVIAVGSCPA